MKKVLKICLLALAFTPVITDNSIFYASNSTESIFLRSIILLVSVLFLFNFFYKKSFKDEIIQKVNKYIKDPISISIIFFICTLIISTIFAVDKYSAFWGTVERSEGLIGIIYIFSFFVFSLLIFEKEDWIWFFKLSLFASLILIFKEFFDIFGGIGKRGSFLGNSAFLSGYLLFAIFSSIIVFSEIKKNFWRYFSSIIFILSILSIFIMETRGTIVALAISFVFLLIFFIIKGKNISYKKLNLRIIAIITLCLIIVFSIFFISTRKSEIWQKVPGLSRLAVIGRNNASTETRLIMVGVSMNAVNPIQNGWKKFLIGWGPENFRLAYGQYFNPQQFNYEVGWFDRAHNKLLDLLVMNGLFGLLAYLSIYFFLFNTILKRINNKKEDEFSLINTGLLFFGISLFIHLLFIFDQITTYISLFSVLAFGLYLKFYDHDSFNKEYKIYKLSYIFIATFFSILILFLTFVFLKNDLFSYIELKRYASLREKSEVPVMVNRIGEVFEPFTIAQERIRYDFLSFVIKNYDAKNEEIVKLSDIAISKGEDYINKRPDNLQFINLLALTYTNQGHKIENFEFLKRGEGYFNKILLIAPNKQDFNYGLALNYLYQKRFNESFVKFENIFDVNPKYFSQEGGGPEGIYTLFIKHFYEVRDKDNFIKTTKRLKDNNYFDSNKLDQILNLIQKYNVWPNINFKQ
ncbi:MAG: O-antigen ligase family protein [Candidatus Nomurabacteria bacterium]|nr:O-antigen ligase family protein [Candidatus Nomurabacteria bacterium]